MKPECMGRPALAAMLTVALAGCGAGSMLAPGSASPGLSGGVEDPEAPGAVTTVSAREIPARDGVQGSGAAGTAASVQAAGTRSGF